MVSVTRDRQDVGVRRGAGLVRFRACNLLRDQGPVLRSVRRDDSAAAPRSVHRRSNHQSNHACSRAHAFGLSHLPDNWAAASMEMGPLPPGVSMGSSALELCAHTCLAEGVVAPSCHAARTPPLPPATPPSPPSPPPDPCPLRLSGHHCANGQSPMNDMLFVYEGTTRAPLLPTTTRALYPLA